MNIYTITETELVTRRFRVIADTEEEAYTILGDEMDLPQATEHCELVEQSTAHRECGIEGVEQCD